jgi:hypothetical protein
MLNMFWRSIEKSKSVTSADGNTRKVAQDLKRPTLDRKETVFCHAKAKPKILGFHRILQAKRIESVKIFRWIKLKYIASKITQTETIEPKGIKSFRF